MSVAVRFEGASFGFPNGGLLLEQLSFQFAPGWTGVVGENGAGKTTLLRLVTGALTPTHGRVRVLPPDATVSHCEQQPPDLPAALSRFGEDPGPAGWEWMGRLEVEPTMLARWPQLSPGEQKRLQLAEALAAAPDVLLLDEPTNHLDSLARERVLSALARFRGVGVVVSHDREVLNRLTQRTLRVHDAAARLWPLAYDAAREAWRAEATHHAQVREAKKAELEKAHRQLAERRRAQAAAERQRSTAVRMKDRHDHDARTLGADFRASSAEKRIGREVQVARRAYARAEEALAAHGVRKERGSALEVDHAPAPTPLLLRLLRDTHQVGGRTLWRDLSLTLQRTDRVWLSGPNGAGKSTLLKALHQRCALPPDRVLYLPQELSAEQRAQARAALDQASASERSRVLTRVAALGLAPERLLHSAAPSPGEVRKLLLAHALEREAWLLVLDEPTNHLDLPSVERLEEALRGFEGGLLLVSHDARFAQALCAHRWHLEGGALRA